MNCQYISRKNTCKIPFSFCKLNIEYRIENVILKISVSFDIVKRIVSTIYKKGFLKTVIKGNFIFSEDSRKGKADV